MREFHFFYSYKIRGIIIFKLTTHCARDQHRKKSLGRIIRQSTILLKYLVVLIFPIFTLRNKVTAKV